MSICVWEDDGGMYVRDKQAMKMSDLKPSVKHRTKPLRISRPNEVLAPKDSVLSKASVEYSLSKHNKAVAKLQKRNWNLPVCSSGLNTI